jgi:hypothetical protein
MLVIARSEKLNCVVKDGLTPQCTRSESSILVCSPTEVPII